MCARKLSNITPEYSEHFESLYSIKFDEVQESFEHLWKFYEICHNEVPEQINLNLSPTKTYSIKMNIRESRSACETPAGESKKTIHLMPRHKKHHLVTLSDMQTPKEKSQAPELKKRRSNIQGFSDLFPIAEEVVKNKAKIEQNETNIEDGNLDLNYNSNQNEQKSDNKTRKVVQNNLKPRTNQKINKILEDKSLISHKTDLKRGNKKIRPETSLILSKQNLSDKHQSSSTEVVNLTLQNSVSLGPVPTVLPSPVNEQYGSRISQHQKLPNERDNSTQNKSVRRNRQERLKSAHSSQRQDEKDTSQSKPISKKYSAIKNATNRVMPKVCGASSISRPSARVNNLVRKNLNFDSSQMNSQLSISNLENNISLEHQHSANVPFLNRNEVRSNSKHISLYGPLLTQQTSNSMKNSFIESKVYKLQTSTNANTNKFDLGQICVEPRNPETSESKD